MGAAKTCGAHPVCVVPAQAYGSCNRVVPGIVMRVISSRSGIPHHYACHQFPLENAMTPSGVKLRSARCCAQCGHLSSLVYCSKLGTGGGRAHALVCLVELTDCRSFEIVRQYERKVQDLQVHKCARCVAPNERNCYIVGFIVLRVHRHGGLHACSWLIADSRIYF